MSLESTEISDLSFHLLTAAVRAKDQKREKLHMINTNTLNKSYRIIKLFKFIDRKPPQKKMNSITGDSFHILSFQKALP